MEGFRQDLTIAADRGNKMWETQGQQEKPPAAKPLGSGHLCFPETAFVYMA